MKIIGKKRIMKAEKYMSHIAEGEVAYIGLSIDAQVEARLREIGFTILTPGNVFTPSPKLGRVSKFNVQGKEVPQKDKPKETAYRQQYWELTDWHGNLHTGYATVSFQRYPRKQIPAPSLELRIIHSGEKRFVVAGPSGIQGETEPAEIVHAINIMLEIFKEAEIFQENFQHYELQRPRELNWDVLPQGEMPWETFARHLKPVLERKSKGKKHVIRERLEAISKHHPDFHAVGKNGYHGYIIFGFSELNLFIFENAEYGNATYVFEDGWERLSQMSKGEIISSDLHLHRFVHQNGWERQIERLFAFRDNRRIS